MGGFYGIYRGFAGWGGVGLSGPLYPLDPDAISFMVATGIPNDGTIYFSGTPQQITGAGLWSAVNILVYDLKGTGPNNNVEVWTSQEALYPFVGGTAFTHKWNLKNPADTNGAFRLLFSGAITHSGTGALPDGSTGVADTFLVPNTALISDSAAGYYSGTNANTNTDQIDMGTINVSTSTAIWLSAQYNASGFTDSYLSTNTLQTSPLLNGGININSTGYYLCNRKGTAATADKNSTQFASGTDSNGLPQTKMYLFACNISDAITNYYTNRECRFSNIGNGLTAPQRAGIYNSIEAFQVTLGRSTTGVMYFFGDSFTAGNYSTITDTNRYSYTLGIARNQPTCNDAVSGQSLTQNCTAASNFNFNHIPKKTSQDNKIFLCWSFLNDAGTTVTAGKPGVPFTNTPANMAEDLHSLILVCISQGWAASDIVYHGNYYMPTLFVSPALIYSFAAAAITQCGTDTVQFISEDANIIANGGDALCLNSFNAHPNLSCQPVFVTYIQTQLP